MRGLMIDAARLPEKPVYYRRIIDFCAEWKINTILLRLADDQGSAFRFMKHPELVTHDHALSPVDASELATYAARHGVTVIPEIETFGHTSYITSVPQYAHLADTPPGTNSGFVGICPVHPDTRALIRDLVQEIVPTFPSTFLHCGCDEVNWGGSEMSRQALAKQSRAEIWADYLNWLNGICKQYGNKEMIVWGDYVAHKEPDILPRLDKSVVVMDWQYYVTDAKPLADTARTITSGGFRAIGAPALTTCEWGPRPSAQSLANVESYVTAHASDDPKMLGVIVTNWVPGRYLANSLWDSFAYAAVAMSNGPEDARRLAFRQFVDKFYGAKWDPAWENTIKDLYRLAPGRTCARDWHPPRLPLPAASDDEVKTAAAAKPLDPAPYLKLADSVRALMQTVQRNKIDFASFSLTADYLAHIVWREAQWPKLRSANADDAAKILAEITVRDGEIVKRLDAEWSLSRFEDDRWKRERLAHLTPYDQLLMRMQQAATYSEELAKDPQRLTRLFGAAGR